MTLNLTQQLDNAKSISRPLRPLAARRILNQAVISLISRDPVYGLLMAKVNRSLDDHVTGPFGLGWRAHQLVLFYNPNWLVQLKSGRDLLNLLIHVALHIIWLHPVIYPEANLLTKVATDVEVNQYVPHLPRGSVTLNWLNRKFGLRLPDLAGSRFYLRCLVKFFRKNQLAAPRLKSALQKRLKDGDSHARWNSGAGLSRGEKTILLKRLVQRSYHQTGEKGRGLLPGSVQNRLLRMLPNRYVKWQRYVRLGLGSTPFGQKPSRARFNRRQAYRMDLMGHISNSVQAVSIFVDNSGSMGNAEISYLLAQIGDFLRQFPVRVTIYSFDTQIHEQATYSAHNYHQLRFHRFGGGGTRFQSIFDFCHRRAFRFMDQLIMILTDGQGEHHLNYHHINRLLWLLTEPAQRFSVQNRRGRIVSLPKRSERIG